MGKNLSIFPAIFVASLSSLSYEITLTRIFSISLWYHFAFMVISIAMLGIGASGTLLSVYPERGETRNIPLYLLLFSISIPASYLLINAVPFDPARLSWDRTQIMYITLYYLLLSFPFFFFGLAVASAFASFREYTGYIYAADLTGAGAGSLLVLWLLSAVGPEHVVFIISALSVIPLLLFGNKIITASAVLVLMLNLGVLYAKPDFMHPQISPYKPLETALKFPGAEHLKTLHSPFSRVDIFRSPAVRYAPGLSLQYLADLPEQTGISVDAGDVYAVTKADNRKSLRFLEYLPSSMPYEMAAVSDVLILEPKGGLAVLAAEYFGAGNIFKIDSDPLLIRAVKENLTDLSSGVYQSNTWTGLGRSWLARAGRRFDLIDMSVMGSMPSGSFGFYEDYRFTVEAFGAYLGHLNPDGFLTINLFIIPPPRNELRILNTIIEAAGNLGIKDPSLHIASIRSWGTITLLFKRSALSDGDIRHIRRFTEERKFDLIYLPGIKEQETNIHVRTPANEYFAAFENLLSPERRHFTDNFLFDIRPVHDEDPFFHYYLKIENIREIYRLMGEKWQYFMEEGYLLPVIFLQVLFLGLLLISLPAARTRTINRERRFPALILSYFGFLGTGFMFIEISFIQKMILPLENPSYAAAAVLSSMLISSGIGSLLSQKVKAFQSARMLFVLTAILFLYGLFLPVMTNALNPYSLGVKLASVFIIVLPAGLLMGVPFPTGLSLLGREMPEMIPWAWAVNGCFSVLSPILAVMIAISAGFRTVIFGGVLMYLLAFISLKLRHPFKE